MAKRRSERNSERKQVHKSCEIVQLVRNGPKFPLSEMSCEKFQTAASNLCTTRSCCMYLGTIQRLLRVNVATQQQAQFSRVRKMAISNLLTAALPETYTQQLGKKRQRLEQLFSQFDPPELQVFESQREHYRMRYDTAGTVVCCENQNNGTHCHLHTERNSGYGTMAINATTSCLTRCGFIYLQNC